MKTVSETFPNTYYFLIEFRHYKLIFGSVLYLHISRQEQLIQIAESKTSLIFIYDRTL